MKENIIMIKLAVSSVCKVFENNTVGTKADKTVLHFIAQGVAAHDASKDRAPGQHYILLPDAVLPLVSVGVGLRTNDPEDYVVRLWRGRCEMFLRREKAAMATGAAAIVYSREAYGKDPDVSAAELAALEDATHVLVAILAFAGPASPPATWTFIRNLAGANNEELQASGDDIRAKAKAVHDYYEKWCVVADAPLSTAEDNPDVTPEPRFLIMSISTCARDFVEYMGDHDRTEVRSEATRFSYDEAKRIVGERTGVWAVADWG